MVESGTIEHGKRIPTIHAPCPGLCRRHRQCVRLGQYFPLGVDMAGDFGGFYLWLRPVHTGVVVQFVGISGFGTALPAP